MAKNLVSFYLHSEKLSDVEFKGNRLIWLAEEISRQESIQVGAKKTAIISRESSIAGTAGKILRVRSHLLEVLSCEWGSLLLEGYCLGQFSSESVQRS